MEEGSLRCDLNVSIAPIPGASTSSSIGDGGVFLDTDNPFQSYLPPGTGNRVEVKNLNSIKQGKEFLRLIDEFCIFFHIVSFLRLFFASFENLFLFRKYCIISDCIC